MSYGKLDAIIQLNNYNNDKANEVKISSMIYDAHLFNSIPIFRMLILLLISFFLSAYFIFDIALHQYDQYNNYINGNNADWNETKEICKFNFYSNLNVTSIILVIPLIILYILIFKRRVFLSGTFKFRNIGLPSIVSCWNKSDRLYTSLTYGIIN